MKVKFNGMDLFIIVLLIAALAAGSWFLMNRSQQKGQTQNAKVELMVELTSQEESFVDLPKVGDEVVIGEKEKMQTTVPGLYAAGDCTGGLLQVAKAVYEGAQAGTEAAKALRKG